MSDRLLSDEDIEAIFLKVLKADGTGMK
ncbi:hypothetical protein LCGC14_2556790, partial [marine sediment metagenome]